MTANFHKGITQEVKRRLMLAGIRIEEKDAQLALAGELNLPRKNVNELVDSISEEALYNRFDLMRDWTSEHPGEQPYPPLFVETALEMLRGIDASNPMETIVKLIALAEEELDLG